MLPESPQSPIDPLIGRTRDIAAVEAALAGGRLVTITGLGGAGKTRLAREVLRRALARGRRGWFVDLAHVTSPAGVPDAIAAVVGVGDSADIALPAAIALEIGRSDSLLVLDNLEQVIGARRFIAELAGQAPASRVLGTSRLRLAIRGEVVVTLDPLVLPASSEDLERSGASRLFLARARERGGLGPLTDEDRRAVVEICRRLDGLPLALELGAAWTRLLRPPAILRRLEAGRLTLANDDADDRHANLETVVDSTLGLVTDADRAVFESLGAFAGGFDEPAAVAVSAVADALLSLRRLEDVGLVNVVGERDGEPRFALLETIRAAAVATLEARGTDAGARRRHAEWFAAWAAPRVESLRRVGDPATRAAFDAETPNLWKAHAFAVETGDALLALRLATAMGVVGRRSPGSLREHIARLEQALGMGDVPPSVRCEGLNALAWLVDDVPVDSTSVESVTAEAVRLAEALDDPLLLARTLITRATVAVPPDAVALLERAAEIATTHGLPFEAASAYNNAADVLGREGRLEEARSLSAQALAVSTASGDRFGRALALQNGGEIDANLGRFDDAVACLVAAIDGHSVASSGIHLARSLSLLAAAESLRGRSADAYRSLARSADLVAAADAPTVIVNFLGDAVTVLLPAQRITALHALGAVRSAEERTARLLGQPLLAAAEASATAAIGPAKVGRALAAGAGATPRGVFDEVRAVLGERGVGDEQAGTRVRGAFGQLTDREMDVLRLLAEARSDGEIAEALDISPKTSSVHVANIKSKLGVETRMEAALTARTLLEAAPAPPDRSITDRSPT